MKVKINRERPGRKMEDAPKSMFIFDDDGNWVGEIEFSDSQRHGLEVIVYSYDPGLSVGAAPHT